MQNIIEAMEDEDATENTEDTQSTGDWKVICSCACASTPIIYSNLFSSGKTGSMHARFVCLLGTVCVRTFVPACMYSSWCSCFPHVIVIADLDPHNKLRLFALFVDIQMLLHWELMAAY